MQKPTPDMNTQVLLNIQEEIKMIRMLIGDLKLEVKVQVHDCKRALDQCKAAFKECARGYRDIERSYTECSKGFEAIKEQCEEMEDTFMSCTDGSQILNV